MATGSPRVVSVQEALVRGVATGHVAALPRPEPTDQVGRGLQVTKAGGGLAGHDVLIRGRSVAAWRSSPHALHDAPSGPQTWHLRGTVPVPRPKQAEAYAVIDAAHRACHDR